MMRFGSSGTPVVTGAGQGDLPCGPGSLARLLQRSDYTML
jgi:hypothetical protein